MDLCSLVETCIEPLSHTDSGLMEPAREQHVENTQIVTTVVIVRVEQPDYGKNKTTALPATASNYTGPLQEVRMKRMLWALALAIVTSAFAQQQPPTGPPYTTPPTFPKDKAPKQEMPPDTKAPPPSDSLSAAQVQRQIQEKLSTEPALANTNVGVKATGKAVTLTGLLDTEQQHEMALRIAQSYAGDRKIVDKIKIRGRA